MTVTTQVPLGNPAIFGVNVLPINKVLGQTLGLGFSLLTNEDFASVPDACTYDGKSYDSGSMVCMPQPRGKSKLMQCQRNGDWKWTNNYCPSENPKNEVNC